MNAAEAAAIVLRLEALRDDELEEFALLVGLEDARSACQNAPWFATVRPLLTAQGGRAIPAEVQAVIVYAARRRTSRDSS